ncbi:phage repressor protein CI [Serratia fonticola]|uniref:phage repressor protein CI n=1 Tax=Serratia fonticola TaxID=47917 RepID=UPI003BB7463E
MIDLNNLNTKNAMQRIVQAYGLRSVADLSRHYDTSAGTIANRIARNTFPYDYVVRCALDTGASLEWLVTGKGTIRPTAFPQVASNGKASAESNVAKKSNLFSVESCTLEDGILTKSANVITDKSLLINKIKNPLIVIGDRHTYITEREFVKFTNGKWLVTIGQNTGVYELAYADDDHIIVSGGEYIPAREFKIDTLTFISRVKVTCTHER